jgi:hypothetical protein
MRARRKKTDRECLLFLRTLREAKHPNLFKLFLPKGEMLLENVDFDEHI